MSGRTLIPIILILILGYVFYNEVVVRGAAKNLLGNKGTASRILGSKDKKPETNEQVSPEAINRASQVATRFLQQVQAGNFSGALGLYSQSAFDGFSPQEKLAELQRQRSEMFGRLQNFQLVGYSQESGQISLKYDVTYEKTNTQETFVIAVGGFSGGGNFSGGGIVSRGGSGNRLSGGGGNILKHYVSSNVF